VRTAAQKETKASLCGGGQDEAQGGFDEGETVGGVALEVRGYVKDAFPIWPGN
jgi:hypothetical protein